MVAIAFLWRMWCWWIPPLRSEIPGTYACDYGYGIQTLTIGADRNYHQQFTAKSGGTWTNAGTWTFDHEGDVALHDPMMIDDGLGTMSTDLTPKDGYWPLNPERSPFSGKVMFNVDDDLELEFHRVETGATTVP